MNIALQPADSASVHDDRESIRADTQAVMDCAMTGKLLDPAIERRVKDRAQKIREEVRERRGVLNVAVDLIREIRDEE